MKFSVKKSLAAMLAFSVIGSLVFAVEVNENELKSTSEETIVFENYTGPHSKVDTLAQIKAIGTSLAKEMKNSGSNAGNQDKYYVIHAVNPAETGKLEADIIILGKNANVDHVRNLRHIIAAYLSENYGYSDSDAHTVATFVTVYNAVYRGKMDYFQSKYKSCVTDNLDSAKCGLSVSYKEWAGNSQIVIPLGDASEGLSSVDTSVISDKKVVESMREEDDKGLDERKNMVDIKEREAEQAQEKANEAAKKASAEEQKLKEEKKDLQEKQQDAATKAKEAEAAKKDAEAAQKKAEEAKQEAAEAQKNAAENPGDKEAAKEADKKAEEAKKAEEEAEQKTQEAEEAAKNSEEAKEDVKAAEESVEQQQAKTEEAKQEAAEEQAKADKKQNEAANERQEIAKDQKELIKEELNESVNSIYALKLVDANKQLCQIVKVDRRNGDVLRESPVKVIHNRMVYKEGLNYVAVAGENSGSGAVKLVTIDATTLEIIAESEETLAENSVLVKDVSNYYCVIVENNKAYVAAFDADLKCVKKSNVEVNPATPVFMSLEGIFVTTADDKVKQLNYATLEEVERK